MTIPKRRSETQAARLHPHFWVIPRPVVSPKCPGVTRKTAPKSKVRGFPGMTRHPMQGDRGIDPYGVVPQSVPPDLV